MSPALSIPRLIAALLIAATVVSAALAAEPLPTDEAGAAAYLESRGVQVSRDKAGQAVRVMSGGKEGLTPDEYQLLGLLVHVEQMGLNAAPLDDSEWGFLHKMTGLKRLSIWHGHKFKMLKPFCGLRVESLTIGGCMGLRDLNDDVADRRDAILALRDLPNLTHGNWYHSPLLPGDEHIDHVVSQFPKLVYLKLDFNAPRGSETTVTSAGLASLARLPLTEIYLEGVQTLTAEHYEAIAKIKTLETLIVDARRTGHDDAAVDAFKKARPEVAVVIAPKGSTDHPRAPRK